jgi:plasmid stabilization system protein ParE
MPLAYPLVPRYESRGIRRRPVGDYLIFYRLQDNRVEIVHILHSQPSRRAQHEKWAVALDTGYDYKAERSRE